MLPLDFSFGIPNREILMVNTALCLIFRGGVVCRGLENRRVAVHQDGWEI